MTTNNSIDSPETPDSAVPSRYGDIIKKLTEPLPSNLIKVRPGATTKDKKKAIALAYYDWRIMVNRLNSLIGGEHWYAHLSPWGNDKIFCTLTILGVPKDSSGEGEADDENGGTSAEQQAKKRAMAEHGLNYLYLLPQVWGEYDAVKKCFINPQALVEEMYRKANIDGLDLRPYISSSARPSSGKRTAAPPAASTTTGASAPEEGAPPSEPTAENAASVSRPDEKTIKGIKALCKELEEAEPDFETLTAQNAKLLLKQLTNKYRASRKRQEAAPASTR